MSRTIRRPRCCAITGSTWPRASTSAGRSTSTRLSPRPPRAGRSTAQLGPLHLAAGRLRQLGGELDDAGELVGRRLALAVLLQLAGQLVAWLAIARYDDRPHHRAALRVRRGDGGGLGDRRVGEQGGLDLDRSDPVAGGDDDVVAASLEPEVAVVLLANHVAGRPPLVLAALTVEVAAEEGGGGGGLELQFPVLDPDDDSRQRLAHRARSHRLAAEVAGDVAGLGLTVAIGGL